MSPLSESSSAGSCMRRNLLDPVPSAGCPLPHAAASASSATAILLEL